MTRRRLLPLMAACIGLDAYATTQPIAWGACSESMVGAAWPDLGERLRCARVAMPLDHDHIDERRIEVGVVRISAAQPSRREGTIFFNVGGPGGQPAQYLASMLSSFGAAEASDPLHGRKRELSDRFDFVAVIPRGLKGGWEYDCMSGITDKHAFLPTHDDDANWAKAAADAGRVAGACTRSVESAYISTWQHVHDMEAIRVALGESRIHFYGLSYGGKVGAWYTSLFPQRVDRLLLDSSFYFAGDYTTAIHLSLDAQQARFESDVLAPLLRDPARWGQSTFPGDAQRALKSLRPELRPAWHDQLLETADVAAALSMSRQVHTTGWLGWDRLRQDFAGMRLSDDPDIEAGIRRAGTRLLQRGGERDADAAMGAFEANPYIGMLGESVYRAVLCNDDNWLWRLPTFREAARRDADTYLTADGEHSMLTLTCAAWRHPQTPQPNLDPMVSKPYVLLQAEFDIATPAAAARVTTRYFPGARLLFVLGAREHGLLGRTATPCIERDAARYLLDGTLPRDTPGETSCEFVPVPGEA